MKLGEKHACYGGKFGVGGDQSEAQIRQKYIVYMDEILKE